MGDKQQVQFTSVQSLSHVWLFATPWTSAHQAFLSITKSQSPSQTHIHWIGDAIQPSHSLLSPSPPAFNPSHNRVFSNESILDIRWPKYWSFSFSISPANEYSGLISFRIDWFDLLAFQTLSRVFSSTTVQKQQFFGTQPSLWSNSHICTWLPEKNNFDYMDICQQSNVSAF